MSIIKSLKDAKNKVLSIIDTYVVDDVVRNDRLSICNSCEYLFHATRQCKKCGCLVDAKTLMPNSSCPIEKWSSVDVKK